MRILSSVSRLINIILSPIFPLSRNEDAILSLDAVRARTILPEASPAPYPWIHSLFNYKDKRVKTLIQLIKYKNNEKAVTLGAELLLEEILAYLSEDLEQSESFFLIPIPMHKERVRTRGWNQAEVLAENISRQSDFLMFLPDSLTKTTKTPHQTSLSRKERLTNIAGSFSIKDADVVRGKRIILIDDVTTTGATLTEAKRVLKEAGCREVIAFTLAH